MWFKYCSNIAFLIDEMKIKQANRSISTPPGYYAFASCIGYNDKCPTGKAINTSLKKLIKHLKYHNTAERLQNCRKISTENNHSP
jgi:hypothetical protein